MRAGSFRIRRGTLRLPRASFLRGAFLPPFLVLFLGGLMVPEPSPSVLGSYDLSKNGGEQVRLARGLREISGLAVDAAGHLFAHNDERAVVYQLDPESGETLKTFSAGFGGAPGDFEGIAAAGSRIFLSTSAGGILETSEGAQGASMDYRLHSPDYPGRCEFEGLAFDANTNSLLLPCKKPRGRELRDHIVVFSVDVGTKTVAAVPRIFLPLEELEALDLDPSFSPSGIEVHPATGHLLLVSGQDETLLEFSPEGAILGGVTLHKKTHPQPEGIAFGLDGTLFLADEGQGKRGRLTRYPLQDQGEGDLR